MRNIEKQLEISNINLSDALEHLRTSLNNYEKDHRYLNAQHLQDDALTVFIRLEKVMLLNMMSVSSDSD